MPIGVGASSPYPPDHTLQRPGGRQDPGIVLGLRGAASVGSGLRTGLIVVDHAIRSGVELDAARHRAREAALQERLEHVAAEADALLHVQHHRDVAEAALAGEEPAGEAAAAGRGLEAAPAAGPAEDESTRLTIAAAVAAGEAGDVAPRGAYLDFSI